MATRWGTSEIGSAIVMEAMFIILPYVDHQICSARRSQTSLSC